MIYFDTRLKVTAFKYTYQLYQRVISKGPVFEKEHGRTSVFHMNEINHYLVFVVNVPILVNFVPSARLGASWGGCGKYVLE